MRLAETRRTRTIHRCDIARMVAHCDNELVRDHMRQVRSTARGCSFARVSSIISNTISVRRLSEVVPLIEAGTQYGSLEDLNKIMVATSAR